MVGKISNHEEDSAQVKRGDEKGMFEFGGSTIVVMTEPGMAEPDKDIIQNTKAQAETLVKMGELLVVNMNNSDAFLNFEKMQSYVDIIKNECYITSRTKGSKVIEKLRST